MKTGSVRRSTVLRRPGRLALGAVLLAGALPALGAAPASAASSSAARSAARSAAAFADVAGRPAPARRGTAPEVAAKRFRALELDRPALADVLADAPRPGRIVARGDAIQVSLPTPGGGTQRFAVRRDSVMEPALAAAHPEIATYTGTGIDDPGATVSMDLTPLGFHASVRGPGGAWYVDPYYRDDQSVYASYRGADLVDGHGPFDESDVQLPPDAKARVPEPRPAGAVVSTRTYRLALLSDPTYATYFGTANVTAAKATLISRVNQMYEDDFAIHLNLIDGTDALNLDTDAKMTGANGPCGSAACYTAAEAAGCDVPTLDRNTVVLGQLVGASNYDIGHLALGTDGGGIAGLGVVGDADKATGCTGVTRPVGDLYAVDYVAHEMGHQFGGNHTFNGVYGSCSGANRNGATSVEPGSGSTVMAYAGICSDDNGADDLQPHSDPYFSERSIDEITTYADGNPTTADEVQGVALRSFDGTDAFKLTYGGQTSAVITRGTNYTASGIETALEAILTRTGTSTKGTVTIEEEDGSAPTLSTSALGDAGFTITFSGSFASFDASAVGVVPVVADSLTAAVGERVEGGTTRNGGDAAATANTAPTVTVPGAVTIPVRTPFSLTGSATDPNAADALTYLWEQNDPGFAPLGTGLTSNLKTNGPLFRVFGTTALVSDTDTILTPSPGENTAGTSGTRDFPDLAQVVAGNTNAASGTCTGGGTTAASLDCFSEFLPTALYAGPMHFRLTARDNSALGGGVAHADTTVSLSATSGPFRVTTPAATGTTLPGGVPTTVAWDAARTASAPVSAANVKISLSTDGGLTFPTVLAASTPNSGTASVTLPNVDATKARLKIEAVGNVFFDVSHSDFAITKSAIPDPPATTPTTPTTPATPVAVARLAPVLSSVSRRVRISRTGRVSVKLRCRTIGKGTAPKTCSGTLKLTAKVRGRTRTIGTARFSFSRLTTKTVRIRLTTSARKALRRSTTATLTVRVKNGKATSSATKRLTVLPRRG